MNKYSDDQRLTAYILGELSDEERQKFESELESNDELKKELEEIKKTISDLRQDLQSEEFPSLSQAQKEEIRMGQKEKRGSILRFPSLKILAPFATAATIVIALAILFSTDVGKEYFTKKEAVPSQHTVLAEAEEAYDASVPAKVFAPKQEAMPSAPAMRFTAKAKAPVASGAFSYGGAPAMGRVKAFNTERYDRIYENDFILTSQDPRSTFSIDVDTASYSNVRRFLNEGKLPPKDAVRIEEMINYFSYDYPKAKGDVPFAVDLETAASPWHKDYRLVRIGIKGKDIEWNKRPDSNLVFLLDVSGSMDSPNKLPLLKRSMKLAVDKLTSKDRVAIVVYAGASGLVLSSTSGNDKAKILGALNELDAGGSTNGGQGIELAYRIAQNNFIKNGINRVILATDGDFNVGTTSEGDLTRLIEEKAKSGVFLTVLGFGMGNLNDSTMEKLADKGNGNYAYIDNFQEARKVMNEQLAGTLLTIAKDVKIQIEFNPATVEAHRLVGYENRMLEHQDFNDDRKDAGEIGAGHTVTALYEIVPSGVKVDIPGVDPLKYQKPAPVVDADNKELMTLKIRYKDPKASKSKLLQFTATDSGLSFKEASKDFQFAAAVASFGMLLRDSEYKGKLSFNDAIQMAKAGKGEDEKGYKGEMIRLIDIAKSIK